MCDGTYQYCSGLGGRVPPWPRDAESCDQCYLGTGATGLIPAWPETMTSARMCYQDCKSLTGAWKTAGTDPAKALFFSAFLMSAQLTPLVWTSFAGLPPGGYP